MNLEIKPVTLDILCGSEELHVSGSYYLLEGENSREFSGDDLQTTVDRYVKLYRGTTNQFSINECYKNVCNPDQRWIITPRKSPLGKLTPVKGNSKEIDTSYTQSIVREFEEETGSRIDPSFFHVDPANDTSFCLNIHPSAKNVLNTNFEKVKPATETYSWQWVPTTKTCAGKVVMPSDITETEITKAVVISKQKIPLVSARTQVAKLPDPLEGETKEAYIARMKVENPKTSPIVVINTYLAFERKKKGAKRTIRQKKSRHSKKRGTLKRGVRRSH